MAWYMNQAVSQDYIVALTQAYCRGNPGCDATDQLNLNRLEQFGVTTPQGAYEQGLKDFQSTFDPQLLASIPMSDPGSDTARATTQGFGDLRFSIPSFSMPSTVQTPWGTTAPLVPIGQNGGASLPTTGLPSTGVGWLDQLIDFGTSTFLPGLLQPGRLPMPGGGTQPRLPPAGGTRPPVTTINIPGRGTRTISPRQAAAIAAAAAALGITVQEYIERYGLPPTKRRMNVLNPRALSRALRRADGFACFARRVVKITDKSGFKRGRGRKKCGRGKC